MALPEPEAGLVIRYAYLWKREADGGQVEGGKDRPCALLGCVRPFYDLHSSMDDPFCE